MLKAVPFIFVCVCFLGEGGVVLLAYVFIRTCVSLW